MSNCASSWRMLSRTTPTIINKLTELRVNARTSVIIVTKNGKTATKPKKIPPPNVILVTTLVRYSWVGLPGRIPGMKPLFRCKFSAKFCCWNVIIV